MDDFEAKEYEVFDLFRKQWALVTAGSMEKFNSCTVSWGSMGTIWTRPGKSGSVVTVYLYPTRYTRELLGKCEYFTVSFLPKQFKRAMGYMGTHTGRDGDKAAQAGLTPVAMGESVAYEEAELAFLCRKVYQHQMSKDGMAEDIRAYYEADPKSYPPVEDGEWQPHWVFVGEIVEVRDAR